MKKIILLTLSLLSVSLFAQDCIPFFPSNEGAVLVTKSYDNQDKLLLTTTYRVNQTSNYAAGSSVTVGVTMVNSNDKMINRGVLNAFCENGIFRITMENRSLSSNIMAVLANNTEIIGAFLDYPNVFNDTYPYTANFDMEGGQFSIEAKDSDINNMHVRVYARKYERNEQIKVPAGNYTASKISFYYDVTQSGRTVTYKGIEWYSAGLGIVRSETYDQNNNLLAYTVLTTAREN